VVGISEKCPILNYNCGDIQRLLGLKLDKIGPLLACVVAGIDTMGGMMLGFKNNNSRERSRKFMTEHLRINVKQAEFVYYFARCGLAHEGAPKGDLELSVEYDYQRNTGKYLYKDRKKKTLILDVTELAYAYLEAVDAINDDIQKYLGYYPDNPNETLFKEAWNTVGDDINDVRVDTRPDARSCSAFGVHRRQV
jgi:hypothetical protein